MPGFLNEIYNLYRKETSNDIEKEPIRLSTLEGPADTKQPIQSFSYPFRKASGTCVSCKKKISQKSKPAPPALLTSSVWKVTWEHASFSITLRLPSFETASRMTRGKDGLFCTFSNKNIACTPDFFLCICFQSKPDPLMRRGK